jgi:hypothetical protein
MRRTARTCQPAVDRTHTADIVLRQPFGLAQDGHVAACKGPPMMKLVGGASICVMPSSFHVIK